MELAYHQSRRSFIGRTGGLATACAVMAGLPGGAAKAQPATAQSATTKPAAKAGMRAPTEQHYLLTNVRLEEGFVYDGEVVTGTRSGLNTLEIKAGKIAAIHAAGAALPADVPSYEAHGQLALPAMRDMHIHLDKTFYGRPWQAPLPRQGKTILDMIAREEKLIPQLLPDSQEHAEQLIALLHSKGTTVARSHCNIDPVSGLKSLENLKRALEKHRADFDCEIVAFPQHGLLLSKVDKLMREAMSMGVDFVGGLDPTNVDGAMEKSLDAMFQIALDTGTGVDIHLHESSPAGVAAIQYMIATVEKNPALRGKVTISHGFALATMSPGRPRRSRHAHGRPGHQRRLDGAARCFDDAAAAAQRQGRLRHDRHRQRHRPLVALRPCRHAGKGQSLRAALSRQRRVPPVPRTGDRDRRRAAAHRQGRAGLAQGRRCRRFHAGPGELLGRGRGPSAGAQRDLPSRPDGLRRHRRRLTLSYPGETAGDRAGRAGITMSASSLGAAPR
jgi:hypothetical protein